MTTLLVSTRGILGFHHGRIGRTFLVSGLVLSAAIPACTSHTATLPSCATSSARWTSCGPYGGPVTAIAFGPDKPQYGFASVQGRLVETTDAGTRWRQVPSAPGEISSIAISPTSRDVYVAGRHGVSVSHDQGETWSAVGNPHRVEKVVLDAAGHPVGGLYEGQLHVLRGGSGWRAIPGLEAHDVAVSGGTILVAGWTGGILASDDRGRSFSMLDAKLRSPPATHLAVDPDDPSIVYAGLPTGLQRSEDGGRTFRPDMSGMGTGKNVWAIDTEPGGGVFVSTTGGVYESPDGLSWHLLPGEPMTTVTAIAVSGTVPLFGTRSGLFRFVAGTWHLITSGFPPLGVQAIESTPDRGLFALTSVGLERGTGEGWTLLGGLGGYGPTAGALAIDPDDEDHLLIGAGSEGPVFESRDGGRTWKATVEADRVTAIASVPGAADTWLVAGFDFSGSGSWPVMFRRGPDGQWRDLRFSSPVAITGRIVSDPGKPPRLLAGAIGAVLSSEDGGTTWIKTAGPFGNRPIGVLAVAPSDPEIVYAGVGYGSKSGRVVPPLVFMSHDGGSSWSPARGGLPGRVLGLAVDPADPNRVAAVSVRSSPGSKSERDVFLSRDGGGLWHALPSGLPRGLTDVTFGPNGALFVDTDAGVYGIRA